MSETPVLDNCPAPVKRLRKRRLLLAALIVVVLALSLPVSNLFIPHQSGTALARFAAGDSQRLEVVSLLERNCLDCHARETKLPFYARLPIAGSLIERDRADGLKYMDMFEELATMEGQPVSEVALAKLEYVVESGTMPPTRYTIMHWDRWLSDAEKDTILTWIRSVRKAHYATGNAAKEFETDPLQPLPTEVKVDPQKVALGNKLFHDVRLSGDNTLSCTSCHALDKGGTDQARTSTGIRGQIGPINAPTVYNAVFNFKQFWDGRAEDLQDQAAGPVANPIEMGANWDEVVEKLRQDTALVEEFKALYPDGITQTTICNAIAEFEATLVTPNSRFDQYLMGKADALTAEELEGLKLFRENGCATCHTGRALGGQSFELMGRRADYFADRGTLTDADNGRFSVTQREQDRFRFKVPTLRNVALTFPYFHDGSQETLEQAVRSMAKYQTRRPFTDQEVEKVVKFLHTLTGEYQGKPLQ